MQGLRPGKLLFGGGCRVVLKCSQLDSLPHCRSKPASGCLTPFAGHGELAAVSSKGARASFAGEANSKPARAIHRLVNSTMALSRYPDWSQRLWVMCVGFPMACMKRKLCAHAASIAAHGRPQHHQAAERAGAGGRDGGGATVS